jgi:hypothetical protein
MMSYLHDFSAFWVKYPSQIYEVFVENCCAELSNWVIDGLVAKGFLRALGRAGVDNLSLIRDLRR